jgi:hypothetical protein
MQALSQVFLESQQTGQGGSYFFCGYSRKIARTTIRFLHESCAQRQSPDQKYHAEGTAEQTEQEEDAGVDRSLQGEGGSIDDR